MGTLRDGCIQMRHRGIKERPTPQFLYENACERACPMWNVPTVVPRAGRCSRPRRPAWEAAAPAKPGPAWGAPRELRAPQTLPGGKVRRARMGTDRIRVRWKMGRQALILMKDETQLLNFKGYPMAFSRHSTKEPADRKSLSTSTNLM